MRASGPSHETPIETPMTSHVIDSCAAGGDIASLATCGAGAQVPDWFELFRAWRRRAAERRHLASLNDRALEDMGLWRRDTLRDDAMAPLWQRHVTRRRGLAELSDHMLRDIGFSRRDAVREPARLFRRE
ncbi:MAG: DUF1127 domain-containing protein [Alphaproteobacteria bacterium]|nr:DUF1127 domain-containing protein [Alphaproteobacteria bacterium]